jgi:Fe-S-cluster containining protein
MRSVRVTVTLVGSTVAATVPVPADLVDAAALVPVLHHLDDVLVAEAEAAIDRGSREITCCSGCTACCFQMVPVTELEAQFFFELVGELPADQRETVGVRVAQTLLALEAEGLFAEVKQADLLPPSELRAFAVRYFRMQTPCPFLEGDSCSIYEHRPFSCREYLVTSPRRRCERFGEATVERVDLPASLFSYLTRRGRTRWIPLVLALDGADRRPESTTLLPGPEHLAQLLVDRDRTSSDGPNGCVADCPQ